MAVGENGIVPVMNFGNGDGYGYNGGMWFVWLIVIFALMGGGFGGWNNNRNFATQADVYAANDMQDLKGNQRAIQGGISSLGNGICDATFALNNTAVNGFATTNQNVLQGNYALDKSVMQGDFMLDKSIMTGNNGLERAITDSRYVIGNAVNENRFATQFGFGDVNRNIDAVRYDNAMNTCKINETGNINTQKILDKLSCMEFNAIKNENENLRLALADARLTCSQQAQNNTIINAIRPYPFPTYNFSCGCNA